MKARNPKIYFFVLGMLLGLYFGYQLLVQFHTWTYLWQINYLSSLFIHSSRAKCPVEFSQNIEEKWKIGIVMVYSESDNGEWGPELMKMVLKNKENYAKYHGYEILNGNSVIDRTRPVAWSKILAMKKYLLNYDYLFYIDMDAVIMNPSIRLESLISLGGKEMDFIMTEDWNGLNTGVWFAKNTLWSLKFLELAWNQSQLVPPNSPVPPHGKHPFEYEQRAFHYLLNSKVWKSRKALPRYRGPGVVLPSTVRALRGADATSPDHTTRQASAVSQQMLNHFSLLPQCSMNSYSLHPLDPYYSSRKESQYVDGDFIIHFAGKKGEIKMNLLKYYLGIAEEKFHRYSSSSSPVGASVK